MKCICENHEETTRDFNLNYLYFHFENVYMIMYEFWYDYVKPKLGKKVKLC